MRDAGICSVGFEIVGGDQVDSNAAWLSQRLRELGLVPVHHVAVGDDEAAIMEALQWLAARCDVVIVGGGLGPTSDDVTREAVAAAAGRELTSRPELEEEIARRFEEVGMRMPASNLRQARLPEGGTAYAPRGTAPGFLVEVEGATGPVPVHVLPGVPWEMKEMFAAEVEPRLLATAPEMRITRIVHVTGMSEAGIAEAVDPVVPADVDVAYLATGTEVEVKLSVPGQDREAAREASEEVVAAVTRALGAGVAGVDGDTLEAVLVHTLTERGETVAVAESATAGQICGRLGDVAGASTVLRGGAVVYATDTKAAVLGVDADLLSRAGPVSDEVTGAMAARVRGLFDADWGIAVTGVAGPDEQDGVPVGTVHWAVAGPDGRVQVHGRRFPGDRATVRGRLGTAAMEALRRRLLER